MPKLRSEARQDARALVGLEMAIGVAAIALLGGTEGVHAGALDAPGMIVLTEEMAIKHLGDGPWTGRTITINHVYERERR